MEQQYAVVADGKVVNTVVWDGVSAYEPAEGTLVALPFTDETDEDTSETRRRYTGGIGWDYVNGEFVDNRPVEEFPV